MMKFLWGLLVGAFLGAIGTMWYVKKNMNVTSEVGTPIANDLPADFSNFYEEFHADSVYQINHVVFPLQGLPAYADSITMVEGTFRFQKEDWTTHKPFQDETGSFKREFKILGDGFVVEEIKDAQNGIGMQRRFAKRGAEWYLIYYAEINFVGKG